MTKNAIFVRLPESIHVLITQIAQENDELPSETARRLLREAVKDRKAVSQEPPPATKPVAEAKPKLYSTRKPSKSTEARIRLPKQIIEGVPEQPDGTYICPDCSKAAGHSHTELGLHLKKKHGWKF